MNKADIIVFGTLAALGVFSISWLIWGIVALLVVGETLGDISSTYMPMIGLVGFLVFGPMYFGVDVFLSIRRSRTLPSKLMLAGMFPLVAWSSFLLWLYLEWLYSIWG